MANWTRDADQSAHTFKDAAIAASLLAFKNPRLGPLWWVIQINPWGEPLMGFANGAKH